MNILVTGAKGFVGKNLVLNLKNIRDGKDKNLKCPKIEAIFEFDTDSSAEDLENYCENADFVFNLAGVNRPKDETEFFKGNFGFAETLLKTLKKHNNPCPVMLASSVQASLSGRYKDSRYGESKLAGEELFFKYGRETGARILVYRFPNIFGKFCRPNYNSAVATFCYNTANGLPLTVNDENTELELLYIDDLICEMVNALNGKETRCDHTKSGTVDNEIGEYCTVKTTYKKTLGEIVSLLNKFKALESTLIISEAEENSFEKKLFSTYISYLPKEAICFPLKMNKDDRGSFTELLKTKKCGQISVNITKPGITKGGHWHNSKWELFTVVSGKGLIRQRKIGSDEIISAEVSGENIETVRILPGYTHEITNLSDSEDLVTVMWANEIYDKEKPDTFAEKTEG